MSVEALKSLFDVLTVVLLGLTFLAGTGVLITGNIINRRQSEQLKTFDSDMTKAKSELATQQERAAKAEGNIALAEQHAAEANAKAEGFRLDIASANERAEKAQASLALAEQHAAEANTKAEGFRLDIAKANQASSEAQAQVAGATVEAAKQAVSQNLAHLRDTFHTTPSRRFFYGLVAFSLSQYSLEAI